jgi:hypothetical protein
VSAPRHATDKAPLAPGRTSSRGPTYALAPKPDLAAPGTALVGGRYVAGTSVAAARVTAVAARLRAAKPAAPPEEIAARMMDTANPRGPLLSAGAGEPSLARAQAAALVATPGVLAIPRQAAGRKFTSDAKVTVRNTGTTAVRVTPVASLPGVRVTVAPRRLALKPQGSGELTVRMTGTRPAGYLTGTLRLGVLRLPLALPVGPPPPAPLSPLRLEGEKGVRFTAGSLTRRGDAVTVAPLGDLTLEILDAKGAVVRGLTPQGGARDLLPGEYAYTLTQGVTASLDPGAYRFRATAHGPAGGPAVVRASPPFRAR